MKDIENRTNDFLRLLREVPLEQSRQEFGFETRLMARLRSELRYTPTRLAWSLMPYFAAGIILLSAWMYAALNTNEPQAGDGLFADNALEIQE